jgi:hypothetical protein
VTPRAAINPTSNSVFFRLTHTPPLLALAFALPLAAPAAEAPAYKSESQAISEIFTSKVTKVYSARDGVNHHVAYVILWRDHEVVVTPPPYTRALDALKGGDSVRCEMRQSHLIPGADGGARMSFALLPRPGDPAFIPSFSPTPPEEQKRLENVSAEVARRRGEREAAARALEKKQP